MAEQPFAEVRAKEPYAVAQANPAPESKWLNELGSGSQASRAWKSDGTTKPNDATKLVETTKTGDDAGTPNAPAETRSQTNEKTPDKTTIEEPVKSRIASGVIAPPLAGGFSASLLTSRTIEAANNLAFQAQRIKSTTPMSMMVRDAGQAWMADATTSKIIVSRADVMKGITAPALPSNASNFKRAALSTLGVGIMLEADRALFRAPETDRSWNLSSLTVPLGVVLGRGAIQKTLFAGAGLLAGHAVDYIAPPPVQNKSALSTFTTLDAVPLGIAFAIPAKSPAVRAGLVGIAWAMGNGLETVAGGFQRLKDLEQ